MIVSDRIMDGDVTAIYNPNNTQIGHIQSHNGGQSNPLDGTDHAQKVDTVDQVDDADDTPTSEKQEHMQLQSAIKKIITSP